MMMPSVTLSPLIFINYLIPSQLLEPLVPQPILLDKVSHRGDYFTYLSVVLVRYAEFRIGSLRFPIPSVAQLNYRTYGRFFGKKAIYFFHSFIEWLPRRLLRFSQLPMGRLRAKVKLEQNADESFKVAQVRGRAEDLDLDVHLASLKPDLLVEACHIIDDITGRGLGIFQKTNGAFAYMKVSHPPMEVQPAMVVALDIPKVRELPFFTGGLEYLSSVWLVRKSQFDFHVGASMVLGTLDHWARLRMDALQERTDKRKSA